MITRVYIIVSHKNCTCCGDTTVLPKVTKIKTTILKPKSVQVQALAQVQVQVPVLVQEDPFYGETTCQAVTMAGKKCNNKAYWNAKGAYYCGVHVKKHALGAVQLLKNPNAKAQKTQSLLDHDLTVEQARLDNVSKGKHGMVTVSKLKMMGTVPHKEGYLSIFPNAKHGSRKDGLGMPELSPKVLGPVEHVMPNLPVALNLENYHQHAKVWPFELNNNKLTQETFDARTQAYNSEIADRHKHSKEVLKQYGPNINQPLFSVYYDDDGKEHRYNYLECRYFYCHYYEILVSPIASFHRLVDLIQRGTNINIIGYDGYDPSEKSLYDFYLDTSRPFGHELVLYSMLVTPNVKDYPWNKYYMNHQDIYKNMFSKSSSYLC